jgi:integrase
MRYPERYIALFLLLTEITVSEICGLKWKYVNLSDDPRQLEGDTIPPKAIAVRTQFHRGECSQVRKSRNKCIPIPDLLCSILIDLRDQDRFTTAEDFVLSSRTGKAVCAHNIAAQRLKWIGEAVGVPRLSWRVFQQTRIDLIKRLGTHISVASPDSATFDLSPWIRSFGNTLWKKGRRYERKQADY